MKTHKNPDGLTHDEFINKYKEMPHIAEICWYFGVYPEQLKSELSVLFGVQNGVQNQSVDPEMIEK